MNTKTLIGTAIGALVAGLPAAAHAQPVPGAVIAVVDTDRIRQSCTACATAIAVLNAENQRIAQRAQALGTPIRAEDQALQTEGQALQTAIRALPAGGQPDPALRQRIQAFETRQQALQQRQVAAQQEVGPAQQTLQRNVAYVREQIDTAIGAATPDVMRQRNANIAIDRGVTIATAPTVDITDAVLAAVNARLTTINTNAPVQTAGPGAATPAPTPTATPTAPRPRPRGR